jgi:hypothetical protein
VKWKTPSALRFGLSSLVVITASLAGAETFRAEASVPAFIAPTPPPASNSKYIPAVPPPKAANPQVLVATPPPLPEPQPAVKKLVAKKSKDKFPRVLPLITFYNGAEGDVYNWWAENTHVPGKAVPAPFKSEDGGQTPLTANYQMWRLSKKVMGDLLRAKNTGLIYGVSPEVIQKFPENYKKTALSMDEMRDLARTLEAKIVVHGDIAFTKSPIIDGGYRMKVHLNAVEVEKGRALGEVLRISDIHPWEYDKMLFTSGSGMTVDAFNELHEQMAQKSDEARPRYVRLIVSGSLTYAQLELLKQKIQRSVRGVRAIRSAAVENEQVALLIDYEGDGGSQQLGQSLSRVQFGPFLTQVVSTDSNQVLFDVMWRGR